MDLVNFFINGRNLIDIVKDAEMPVNSMLAGDYICIHPGEFYGHYEKNIPGKTYLLQCPGYDFFDCWPLLARISIELDRVIWDDFEQPHRGPDSKAGHRAYTLKFVFDRKQYESELKSKRAWAFMIIRQLRPFFVIFELSYHITMQSIGNQSVKYLFVIFQMNVGARGELICRNSELGPQSLPGY